MLPIFLRGIDVIGQAVLFYGDFRPIWCSHWISYDHGKILEQPVNGEDVFIIFWTQKGRFYAPNQTICILLMGIGLMHDIITKLGLIH